MKSSESVDDRVVSIKPVDSCVDCEIHVKFATAFSVRPGSTCQIRQAVYVILKCIVPVSLWKSMIVTAAVFIIQI